MIKYDLIYIIFYYFLKYSKIKWLFVINFIFIIIIPIINNKHPIILSIIYFLLFITLNNVFINIILDGINGNKLNTLSRLKNSIYNKLIVIVIIVNIIYTHIS